MTFYAWIVKSELWRPVTKVDAITRGKHKGLLRVTLPDGKRRIASRVVERKEKG